MTSGKYDHKGIKHSKNDLDPVLCRCGAKWGEHCQTFEVSMQQFCVSCNGEIIGQCEERYYNQGNYCAKCNELSNKMERLRKINDYFFSKNGEDENGKRTECTDTKCRKGFISKTNKKGKEQKKRCNTCIFKKYTDLEKETMFNNLFAREGRNDLLDSRASKNIVFLPTPKPNKELNEELID